MTHDARAMTTTTNPVGADEADGKTHYQLLEVAPWATRSEIQHAYQRAHAAFAPDSVATYMLFTPEEAHEVCRRLEKAFRVLSDANERERYDRALAELGTNRGPVLPDAVPPTSGDTAAAASDDTWNAMPEPEGEETPAAPVTSEDRVGEILAATALCDGPTLQRLREARDVDLGQINLSTKISLTNLRFIEEDNLGELPAPVYLRGYLKQIAQQLEVDPEWVVSGYMARFDAQPASIR